MKREERLECVYRSRKRERMNRMYQYKNKKHKDMLTACYFLKHPKEKKVTEEDLKNWLLREGDRRWTT